MAMKSMILLLMVLSVSGCLPVMLPMMGTMAGSHDGQEHDQKKSSHSATIPEKEVADHASNSQGNHDKKQ